MLTLIEFAEKYGIPYRYVYDASYIVHYYIDKRFDRKCYPEEALYKSVMQLLESRIERHKKHLDDLNEVLQTLKKNR